MQVRFYVGPEHHWTHLRFAHSVLGGERFVLGRHEGEYNVYDNIAPLDAPEVVWVFADLYEQILQRLKGRAIFLPHGLGFKPYMSSAREQLLNRHVTQIWSTGVLEEEKYRRVGVDMTKVRRIGYGVPLVLAEEPEQPDSVFVSVGWFTETARWEDMLQLLLDAPDDVSVYYSVHPSMPGELQQQFLAAASPSRIFVAAEDEMLRMYHHCQRAVGGFSSVLTPFHYLEKPVVMAKTRNRLPGFKWLRVYRATRSPTWYRIMRQSTRRPAAGRCLEAHHGGTTHGCIAPHLLSHQLGSASALPS